MYLWSTVPWLFIFLAGFCFRTSGRDRSVRLPDRLTNKYIGMAIAFISLAVYTVYHCVETCQ